MDHLAFSHLGQYPPHCPVVLEDEVRTVLRDFVSPVIVPLCCDDGLGELAIHNGINVGSLKRSLFFFCEVTTKTIMDKNTQMCSLRNDSEIPSEEEGALILPTEPDRYLYELGSRVKHRGKTASFWPVLESSQLYGKKNP